MAYNLRTDKSDDASPARREAGHGGRVHHAGRQAQEGGRREAGHQGRRLLGAGKVPAPRPGKVPGLAVQVRQGQHIGRHHRQDRAVHLERRVPAVRHRQGVQGVHFHLSVGQGHAQVRFVVVLSLRWKFVLISV